MCVVGHVIYLKLGGHTRSNLKWEGRKGETMTRPLPIKVQNTREGLDLHSLRSFVGDDMVRS